MLSNTNILLDSKTMITFLNMFEWDYFVTITFNPKENTEIDLSNLNQVEEKLKNALQNIEDEKPELKYALFHEAHKKEAGEISSYHYHGLLKGISTNELGIITPKLNGIGYCIASQIENQERAFEYIMHYVLTPNGNICVSS